MPLPSSPLSASTLLHLNTKSSQELTSNNSRHNLHNPRNPSLLLLLLRLRRSLLPNHLRIENTLRIRTPSHSRSIRRTRPRLRPSHPLRCRRPAAILLLSTDTRQHPKSPPLPPLPRRTRRFHKDPLRIQLLPPKTRGSPFIHRYPRRNERTSLFGLEYRNKWLFFKNTRKLGCGERNSIRISDVGDRWALV